MIILLQRVTEASVSADGQVIGSIKRGLLVFVCIERNDKKEDSDRLLKRLLGYRVFADDFGRMNLSVSDIKGGILLIPQFTLAADTNKGMRPSFSSAASPEYGEQLFEYFVKQARKHYFSVETGKFGANMQVSLCNDGPVTFILTT